MRVDWAIPCSSFSLDNGLLSLDGADFNRLEVASLPAPLEFIAALKIIGLHEDFAEAADKEIEAHLLGPDMTSLTSMEFEAPEIEPAANHPEGWLVGVVLPVVVQFTAYSEGGHSLDFYVKGRYQEQRTIPFWIASSN